MSSPGIQEISLVRMAVCYLLFLVSFLLMFYYRMNLSKDAIISTLRMTVQLVIAGLVLRYVFQFNYWYVVLFVLLLPEAAPEDDIAVAYNKRAPAVDFV
jgi:ABC-type iron transport system FetAB permease component